MSFITDEQTSLAREYLVLVKQQDPGCSSFTRLGVVYRKIFKEEVLASLSVIVERMQILSALDIEVNGGGIDTTIFKDTKSVISDIEQTHKGSNKAFLKSNTVPVHPKNKVFHPLKRRFYHVLYVIRQFFCR